MSVDDRSSVSLSADMLAMNLYHEMTWHGWPEAMIDRRDYVYDLADAVWRDRFLDAGR